MPDEQLPAAADTSTRRDPAVRPGPRRRSRLLRLPSFIFAALFIVPITAMAIVPQLFAGWFGSGDPRACDLMNSLAGPGAGHPFGVDVQGCDLYSNVIYGARASLLMGLVPTAMVIVISVAVGSIAAYYGGFVDTLLSRVMDIFFGFPALIGLIIFLSIFPRRDILSLSLALTLFGWPTLARIMRASVLSLMTLEYVTASQALGSHSTRVLLRHVIPNAIGPVFALAPFYVGAMIVSESALTFLGVGLQQPVISWGGQLSTAEQYFTTNVNLLLFPATFLTVTVLGFLLLGDALRQAFQPRSAL